ncbi:hypothetical protein SprV_0100326000 [Sparganum proliferum]
MAIDDKFFKEIFLERPPTSVQTILASGSDYFDISKLAEMAGRMAEVERLSPTTIAQVSQPLTVFTSDLAELKTQTAQLSATVAALQLRNPPVPLDVPLVVTVVMAALAPGPQTYDGATSLEFLGHLIDSNGIWSPPSKVAAARDCPPPTPKLQLQRFLCIVNFYRRFLPNCADTILPLTSLLTGSKRTSELKPAALTSFDARFSHVHLDIVSHLPLSSGCSYLFSCVDRFTRWPEATPPPDIASPTVVKAFLSRWVAIFGALSTITTDRGAQFESNLFQSLLSFLGCTRTRTMAYHPAANGMAERFHRQLKASLRAAADPENCTDHLPLVLLGICSALKPDLDCSAAELMFGATVRLPGEMISPTPRGAAEDPTNLLHRLRQFMRTLSPVPPRSSASPSYLGTWQRALKSTFDVIESAGLWNRPLTAHSGCSIVGRRRPAFNAQS